MITRSNLKVYVIRTYCTCKSTSSRIWVRGDRFVPAQYREHERGHSGPHAREQTQARRAIRKQQRLTYKETGTDDQMQQRTNRPQRAHCGVRLTLRVRVLRARASDRYRMCENSGGHGLVRGGSVRVWGCGHQIALHVGANTGYCS